jgi:hypothetical protein
MQRVKARWKAMEEGWEARGKGRWATRMKGKLGKMEGEMGNKDKKREQNRQRQFFHGRNSFR